MSRLIDETVHRSLSRPTDWVRRAGHLGFAFFFLKGLVWLLLPAAIWLID